MIGNIAGGRPGCAAELEFYRSLYEGLGFKIERMFTGGNTVVTVWQASGTSRDETFVNRTGKTVSNRCEPKG